MPHGGAVRIGLPGDTQRPLPRARPGDQTSEAVSEPAVDVAGQPADSARGDDITQGDPDVQRLSHLVGEFESTQGIPAEREEILAGAQVCQPEDVTEYPMHDLLRGRQ